MKLKGKKIQGANYEYIVIPRADGDLVFKAEAILDMEPFEQLCPMPKPGKVMLPGGETKEDFNGADYKKAIADRAEKRYSYIIIKSLQASTDLEWETVDFNNPETWGNWITELKESGFTTNEINLIQFGVATANNLSQDKIDEARNRFLASLAAAQVES
jgi:hypothetical protein